MATGKLGDTGWVERCQAMGKRVASADDGWDQLERLPREAKLARTMNPRMAGQNLLNQGGSGSRHTENEDRLPRRVARFRQTIAQFGRERFDEPVDESTVLEHMVSPVALRFSSRARALARFASEAAPT